MAKDAETLLSQSRPWASAIEGIADIKDQLLGRLHPIMTDAPFAAIGITK
jgi:hypothetical protein